jgi:hypothetical protein
MGLVNRVALAVLLLAAVGMAACGDDQPAQPGVQVPPCAKVAPMQILYRFRMSLARTSS